MAFTSAQHFMARNMMDCCGLLIVATVIFFLDRLLSPQFESNTSHSSFFIQNQINTPHTVKTAKACKA